MLVFLTFPTAQLIAWPANDTVCLTVLRRMREDGVPPLLERVLGGVCECWEGFPLSIGDGSGMAFCPSLEVSFSLFIKCCDLVNSHALFLWFVCPGARSGCQNWVSVLRCPLELLCLWGGPEKFNFSPTTMARFLPPFSTVDSWAPCYSCRATSWYFTVKSRKVTESNRQPACKCYK